MTKNSKEPLSNQKRASKRLKIEPEEGPALSNKLTKKAGHPKQDAPAKRMQSRAKLSMLPSLPLDILFEIFGHLLPLDILHLARTTKEFRRLLMHKNSTTVWMSAFSQIPAMPECPEDVSYPAWAHLAFENCCHNCFATNVRNISWILRTRLCLKCAKICLEDADTFKPGKNAEIDDDTVEKLLEILPFDDKYLGAECCLISDRKQMVEELKRHQEDRAEFLEKTENALDFRIDHAVLCEVWAQSLADEREQELDTIKTERRDAISAKLVEMGYAEELDFLDEYDDHARNRLPDYPAFDRHPLVRQPKPLKDKNWNTIKDKLRDYMEIVKAHRIRTDRETLIWARRGRARLAWFTYRNKECDLQDLLPNQIDIWLWKPVNDLIEQPSERTTSFHPKMARGKDGSAPPSRASESLGFGVREFDDLERATCVFSCAQDFYHMCYKDAGPDADCKESCMWFPEFVHHPCNALARYGYDDGEGAMPNLGSCKMVEAHHEGKGFRRRQWSTRWLYFNDKASRTVRSILNACGMPLSTRVQQLDQTDPRLVCLKCSFGAKCDGERYFSVMTWRTAVEHNLKKHFGDGQTTFQRISTADANTARILEEAEPARRLATNPNCHQKPEPKPWRCSLCKDRAKERGALTLTEMQKHYDSCHDKSDIEEGVDYYRALDRPPPQPYQVKMKPRDPGSCVEVTNA
ncbi:hypothetical protein BT96DRAFT_1020784 [Gymnopus androsaceus JB14]|uniref:F-box domain-containing protein n=1 Tax=Gymnopus androsaceus JB14 TaxID=1447944 RepID=A0A6A4HHM4_9AGAR|nr:hypothetical protein BT96DRAFT_1020784 [Gymnopus androsaceus JB14]